MNGQVVSIPRRDEHYHVGKNRMWTYAFAGRVDGAEVFAKVPTKRIERRFIEMYITQYGQHPRVAHGDRVPFKHTLSREERKAAKKDAKRARRYA